MHFFDSARRSRSASPVLSWGNGIEHLEPRVLLSTTPLPDLKDMTDQNNTLVRIETDFGTIDLEMYDIAGPNGAPGAPKTVANFLDHVRKGDYDLSFFHRFAKTANGNGFVIQGGGFKYSDADGLTEITGDKIDNEFDAGRSNLARTLAMARLGGDINSATTQWFINLKDHNATKGNNPNFVNLDDDTSHGGPDDGYTVFAHVLNDDSWNVVQDIAALTVHNYQDINNALTGALNEVPTKDDLSAVTPPPKLSSDELIDISDAEVIKAANTSSFYRPRAAYPEGYRGPGTVESIDLVNPGTNGDVQYQVIVRYEKGQGRDTVISTGTMAANVHLHIPVNDFNDPNLNLVRAGAPYAFEVQATGPVAAALNHYDFGSSTGESFFNTDQATDAQLKTWAFGGTGTPIESPADSQIVRRPFLVWDNLSSTVANITITFTLQTGGQVVWTRTTDPMRRDGLEVFNLNNVTRDIAGIRMVSDQKIVAALTVYDTVTSIDLPPVITNDGFTAGGVLGGGLTDGVLAGARYSSAGVSYVSFVNDNDAGASVTLTFVRTGAPSTNALLPVPGHGKAFYNLHKLGLPEGEFFTVQYHSPLVAVAGEYIATVNGDSVSTPFAIAASSQAIFADGRYDPTNPDQSEVLSLFNPYVNKTLSVSITFNFADDKIQTPATFDLAPQTRMDLSTASIAAIVSKINSGAQFANYAIIVNVSLEGGGTGGSVGGGGLVAQLTRYDNLTAMTTEAGNYQLVLPLDSSVYTL